MEETKYYMSSYIKEKERVFELTKISETEWKTTVIIRFGGNEFRAFSSSGKSPMKEIPKGQEIDEVVYMHIYENIENFLNKTEDLFSCFPDSKTIEIDTRKYLVKRTLCIRSGILLKPLPTDIPEYVLDLIPFRADNNIIVNRKTKKYLKELKQEIDDVLIQSYVTQIINKIWPEERNHQ